MLPLDTVHHSDAIELTKQLDAQSVDLILCDLPYGDVTTKATWDKKAIPHEPLWTEFARVIKPKGAIVLTATARFAHQLMTTCRVPFRYKWYWRKMVTGQGNVNARPMGCIEEILVFSHASSVMNTGELMNYYPQKEKLDKPSIRTWNEQSKEIKNAHLQVGRTLKQHQIGTYTYTEKYPTNLLDFPQDKLNENQHPTQKPVALFEYLIKTYTREGDLVFDPTCGSGTTAVACFKTNRHYIVGDFLDEYVTMTKERLIHVDPFQDKKIGDYVQKSLFS